MILNVTQNLIPKKWYNSFNPQKLYLTVFTATRDSINLKALSHLDVLASVWQGIKMYVKRWRTLNY